MYAIILSTLLSPLPPPSLPLCVSFSMDGFRVVRLEDVLSHLDILISATGEFSSYASTCTVRYCKVASFLKMYT